jgi:hypothetical protein
VLLHIVIIDIAGRHTWQVIFVAGITRWAGHADAATLARVSAQPWLFGMIFADPSAVIAPLALHRCEPRFSAPACVERTLA